MKRIDLADKKLKLETIQEFFEDNKAVTRSFGHRHHLLQSFINYDQLFAESMQRLKPEHHQYICYNFTVNICSCIEMYLKDLIIHNGDYWNKRYYHELLSDKITLENAYKLFKEADVTREVIISKFHSVGSYEGMITVLTKLTCKDFVNEMENHPLFSFDTKTLKDVIPNCREAINKTIAERNKIVHDARNIKLEIDYKKFSNLGIHAFLFMLAVDSYCTSRNFDGQE